MTISRNYLQYENMDRGCEYLKWLFPNRAVNWIRDFRRRKTEERENRDKEFLCRLKRKCHSSAKYVIKKRGNLRA